MMKKSVVVGRALAIAVMAASAAGLTAGTASALPRECAMFEAAIEQSVENVHQARFDRDWDAYRYWMGQMRFYQQRADVNGCRG